jgi:hypothetical protein
MFRILFLFWIGFHPVHVSLTSLDYNPDSGFVSGFVRIYLDDFLVDCSCGTKQEKLIAGDKAAVMALNDYLNRKLIISLDYTSVKGEIKNVAINGNEIDINLHYISRTKPGIITVRSHIMTDIYDDQANMVIVKVLDYEEGARLTSKVTEQTFKVN